MSRAGDALAKVGRAAGSAIVRDLSRRLDATAEAIAENAPLDRAAERRIAELEQALVPLLEADRAARAAASHSPRTDDSQ